MACHQRAVDFGQSESLTNAIPETFGGGCENRGGRFGMRVARGGYPGVAVISLGGQPVRIRPRVDRCRRGFVCLKRRGAQNGTRAGQNRK